VLKFGQKIIALAQMDQQSDFPLTDCILVVGGGNGEYILELDGDLEIGQKNFLCKNRFILSELKKKITSIGSGMFLFLPK
jgi:hypothetical protein